MQLSQDLSLDLYAQQLSVAPVYLWNAVTESDNQGDCTLDSFPPASSTMGQPETNYIAD